MIEIMVIIHDSDNDDHDSDNDGHYSDNDDPRPRYFKWSNGQVTPGRQWLDARCTQKEPPFHGFIAN